MKSRLFLILSFLLFFTCSFSRNMSYGHGNQRKVSTQKKQVLTGVVSKVSDGDTFTFLDSDGNKCRVRLYGIDAPEGKCNQPYWQKSRNYLARLIDKKTVKVSFTKRDRYGRILGVVSVPGCDDVNLEMIKQGLAWHYTYYDNSFVYAEAQKAAKAKRIGLWADPFPVNPYDWRQNCKNKK